MLKIPEEFVGTIGTCNHCGGEIRVYASEPATQPGEGGQADSERDAGAGESGAFFSGFADAGLRETTSLEPLSPQQEQARSAVEGLTQEREVERRARRKAEAALEDSQSQTRRIEEKLAAATQDVDRLTKELETERSARRDAQDALEDAQAQARRFEERLTGATQDVDRLTKELDTERSARRDAQDALEDAQAQARRFEERLTGATQDVDRLTKELDTERSARRDAEAALERSEARVGRLEDKLRTVSEENDSIVLRVDLERSEAQLARSRQDVERLASELEEKRAALVETEAALAAAEVRVSRLKAQLIEALKRRASKAPEGSARGEVPVDVAEDATPEQALLESLEAQVLPADEPAAVPAESARGAPSRTTTQWIAAHARPLAGALCCVLLLFIAFFTSPWLAAPRTSLLAPIMGKRTENQQQDAGQGLPSSHTGEIDATLAFVLPSETEGEVREIPAADAPMVLARQRLDNDAFYELLQEAGIEETSWEPFANWYLLTETQDPGAKDFSSVQGLDGAPSGEQRMRMAELAESMGNDKFAEKLGAVTAFDPPGAWKEYASSADATLVIKGLMPGRYLLFPRPRGLRDSWEPLTEERAKELGPFTVSRSQRTSVELKLVDITSVIHGKIIDAETGKAMPNAPLVVGGDVIGGEDRTIETGEDGTFEIDPRECGYGEFAVHCEPLPKIYAHSTTFHGERFPCVSLDPITIQISKESLPKQTKKPRVSGRVLNPDGSPAPDFTIWMTAKDGSAKAVARSGRDGAYVVEHGGGLLRLYARGPGTARTETISLDLNRNESVTRDFVVPKTGSIVLTVLTPEGRPPAGFEECSLISHNQVSSDPTMLQRMGDRFVISYLTPGSYDLSFRVKGCKPVTLPDIVIGEDCSDREFSVTLEPAE